VNIGRSELTTYLEKRIHVLGRLICTTELYIDTCEIDTFIEDCARLMVRASKLSDFPVLHMFCVQKRLYFWRIFSNKASNSPKVSLVFIFQLINQGLMHMRF
jgi:hypothetical protein